LRIVKFELRIVGFYHHLNRLQIRASNSQSRELLGRIGGLL